MALIYDPHRIPFAVGPDGEPVSIHEVPRGRACGCTCPACKAPLVAKQGAVVEWHFAHASGASCAGALESALHLAAKKILAEERRLLVPPCYVIRYPEDYPDSGVRRLQYVPGGEHIYPPYRYTLHPEYYADPARRHGGAAVAVPSKPTLLEFDEIVVEEADGNIRPDLIGRQGERRLYIEIAVTHPVDLEKLQRIRALQTPAVELQIPWQQGIDWDNLRRYVLEGLTGKTWVYSPRAESLVDQEYEKQEPFRLKLAEEKRLAAEAAKRKVAAEAERWAREQEERQREQEEQKRAEAERMAAEAKAQAEQARLAEARERRWKAQLAAERQAREEEAARVRAARQESQRKAEALLTELRTGVPSPRQPLRGPTILLDLDTALKPDDGEWADRLDLMARTLRDLQYNVVVTSEIRRRRSVDEIAEMLQPLGGRHVGVTPIMSSVSTPRSRLEEIESWLASNPMVRDCLMVDGSLVRREPSILLPLRGGMTAEHLKRLWPWIVRHGGEVSYE